MKAVDKVNILYTLILFSFLIRKRRMDEHESKHEQNLKGKKYKLKQPPFNTPIYNDLSKVNVAAVAAQAAKKFGKKHLKEMGKKFKAGKQIKRKIHEAEKKNFPKRKKKIERESSTDSDSDENCAAKKCLKPIGKEVSILFIYIYEGYK